MSVEQCQLMGSGSISASDCTLSFVFFAVMESGAVQLQDLFEIMDTWQTTGV